MYQQITSNKRKTVLLVGLFFIITIALGWFIGVYMGYGYWIFVFAILYSIGSALISYFAGDKVALKTSGAKKIKKEDNPYVYRMVENLCITAGMEEPDVHIIDSPALNAFATGRNPENASIALTTGLINKLEDEELEGVIAHELSHIQNYDTLIMTLTVVLVGTIALIADLFLRARLFGFGGDNKKGGVFAIIGFVLILVSPIVAQLIKLAISRKREYLADASGVDLTRYPEGLASALEKITNSDKQLDTASSATAHLFISNPFKNKFFSKLFSTHPPAEERIKRLRDMA
ncbi:MAG: M48 family metallopeptidase [Candidatus Paceibacteria bacterium]